MLKKGRLDGVVGLNSAWMIRYRRDLAGFSGIVFSSVLFLKLSVDGVEFASL